MAPSKRKSPDKRSQSASRRKQQPSRATMLLRSSVSAFVRYPRLVSGVVIFTVVFSFVAANALWYQPRHHPAPLLATRMFDDQPATRQIPARHATSVDEEPGVTTFRIERENPEAAKQQIAAQQKPDSLVRDIQKALAARGLYDGPADGLSGSRTTSAILFFEETEGLPQSGEASEKLLARLRDNNTAVGVIADDTASSETTASTNNTDAVADLIRAAEQDSAVPVPTLAHASATESVTAAEQAAPVARVMEIQKALAGMAYENIKVDGVVGTATRTAIRAFEKSYRLPVTGEPSERVLKKLKSIGAL